MSIAEVTKVPQGFVTSQGGHKVFSKSCDAVSALLRNFVGGDNTFGLFTTCEHVLPTENW